MDAQRHQHQAPDAGPESAGYGETFKWEPAAPTFSALQVLVSWFAGAVAVIVAAWLLPGLTVGSFGDALVAAALIAVLNAVLPPLVAAMRLPFTAALGFVIVLMVDGLMLLLVSNVSSRAIHVDSFGAALLGAVVIAAATMVVEATFGINDNDTYSLRVTRRIARRQGGVISTAEPGILFLEIDGLGLPVLERAMRDGNVPELARWLADGTHTLVEWETDLSSQTGASQAGILLGSNDGVPAFRWAEKSTGRLLACSAPADCAEIERRLTTADGLLAGGGASRGNLFSGGAEAMILTVSRINEEKRSNPGYRAFLANGFNVTRTLALFFWEVVIERSAAIQQRRRDVRPRGMRGYKYALLRAAVCVAIRDLIVFGVLSDMMRGRPAVYATFSSYDEVAHHSGLERADTLEALRKLDQQFGRIARARRYAPRPYKLVVLSDHGQTQGATFKQRNGYDLQELVRRSVEQAAVARGGSGDENDRAAQLAVAEATGRTKDDGGEAAPEEIVVLGSGNLGLIYLMKHHERLTMEEIQAIHPRLLDALRAHPHIGFVMVQSGEHGPVVLGDGGARFLAEGRIEGEDPLAAFSPGAPGHLLRAAGFENAPDILVNSFYDPKFEEGCAFEELISFHGGMGGPQTRAFILHPVELEAPPAPIVGAAAVHQILVGWRRSLQAIDESGAVLPTVAKEV